MAYIDSINKQLSRNIALCGFGNTFICTNAIDEAKTITFPVGYENEDNLSFKVVFVNGHNCTSDNSVVTPMTLNNLAVVVNQYGTLIPLPYYEMTENNTTVYKSIQPNTCLELYRTSNYDGNNTPAYVVIGNPIVLSSSDYTIYADGYHATDTVQNGNMNAISSNGVYDYLNDTYTIKRIATSDPGVSNTIWIS